MTNHLNTLTLTAETKEIQAIMDAASEVKHNKIIRYFARSVADDIRNYLLENNVGSAIPETDELLAVIKSLDKHFDLYADKRSDDRQKIAYAIDALSDVSDMCERHDMVCKARAILHGALRDNLAGDDGLMF